MCWLVTVVPSESCLPVLVCTDPVGAAGSAEYESEDPSGGYFVELMTQLTSRLEVQGGVLRPARMGPFSSFPAFLFLSVPRRI